MSSQKKTKESSISKNGMEFFYYVILGQYLSIPYIAHIFVSFVPF